MFSATSMRIVVSPVEKKSAEALKMYAEKKNVKTARMSSAARGREGASFTDSRGRRARIPRKARDYRVIPSHLSTLQ